MPETRRFAQGLRGKGTVGQRRESASHAIRSSVYSGIEPMKANTAEPVDYEAYVLKRCSEIQHDPLRNLLTFPGDDISEFTQARENRTIHDTVPDGAEKEASSLMVKECIKTYKNNWNLLLKKYDKYSGDYLKLPSDNRAAPELPEQVFELDEEGMVEEDGVCQPKEGVTKRGWLHKAPDYGVSGISIRSFKRRYFYLKQLPDNSYILNYYKDEKIGKDPKGAIYLDCCIGAHMTTKARKYAFEIRMQDQACHLLAADTEAECDEWIATINQALQNTIEEQVSLKEKQDAKLNGQSDNLQDNVKNSLHPDLIKNARKREMEHKNTLARREGRQNIFRIYPDFQNRYLEPESDSQQDIKPPNILKPLNHRLMVSCKSINFNLRGVVVDGAEEPLTNVEPFFVTLALYDVIQQKKISADLHVDLNHPLVRRMIPEKSPTHGKRTSNIEDEVKTGEPTLRQVDRQWVAAPKKGVFTITKPHMDIYLVARIEKVLQGNIKSCIAPYMRADNDNHKTAVKVLKHAKVACNRLGQYRMPFAWTAKPLFLSEAGLINSNPFDCVYKQESSKLEEEALIKLLSDFKKPDKMGKLEYVDCDLQIEIDSVPTDLPNILTSSFVPIIPYCPKISPTGSPNTSQDPVFEVDEFTSNDPHLQYPHSEYINHCYVYPKQLNYDNQKTFPKARNICVVAEFRDSDIAGCTPLKSFHRKPGPPGSGPFTTRVSAAILHHHERPDFYEEFKLSLPTQLHHGHHILFSFYHVVVDVNAKKKDASQTEVGYAWVPLLTKDGRVASGDHQVPVASSLQPGYLSFHDQLAVGRHGSEVKWVDGGKPLFNVKLATVSSIYTEDPHIHNLFEACHKFFLKTSDSDLDIVNYLKGLLAADVSAVVRYLPTILTQLLYLFTADGLTQDTQSNCIKTLIHIVANCHKKGHGKLLLQYIKYTFVTAPYKDYRSKTIHEELTTGMTNFLRPSTADFLTANALLQHSSFFLQIVVKSMAQHLISTQKLKLKRNERFPLSFQHSIQSLLTTTVPHIVKKWKTNYGDVHNANLSLATFVKECFTYVDRGFVFKLINHYLENFDSGDHKVLFEMKFEFLRIICHHEHYIPLNLPFPCNAKSAKNDYSYCLDDEYCRIHFVTGLLLKSLCSAMFESPDIRSIAIDTFKNILAKHVFDDRYQTRAHQTRIAGLYLPFVRILIDNVGRLTINAETISDTSHSSRDDLTEPHIPAQKQESTPSFTNAFNIPLVGDRAGSLRSRMPDTSVMSAIANPGSSLLSRGSRNSVAVTESQNSNNLATDKLDLKGGTLSIASATRFMTSEKLDATETRSLLLCHLHLINNLPLDALLGFWRSSTTSEQIEFFDVLEVCMHHFKYTGKKQQFQGIRFGSLSTFSSKSKTLPVRIRTPTTHHHHSKQFSGLAEPMVTQASHMVDEEELKKLTLLEANLSTEVGLIVLDMLAEFTKQYKKQLLGKEGDNPLMKKIFNTFLLFLQISQSEVVLKHAFASLRLFLVTFPQVLFRGSADLCASLIYHSLKCANSRLQSTRLEACAFLYLLMRTNYTESGRSFVRSNLQMIKAVSQLISEEKGIGSSRFQHSLSVIKSYAHTDKDMQRFSFPEEVKELTKKIRTVLTATAAMKEHKDDPEKLVDLQSSLAKSYAATPELRKTWLESMARVHEKHANYSEAAMCYVHIAALVAEYLKRKRVVSKGCSAFRAVSPNVEKEESALKEDIGMQDVQYNEDVLTVMLLTCVDALLKAERYELMASVYNLVIPYYEKKRDYETLANVYGKLKDGYVKINEVNRNGKRLLGTYFRVAMYGQTFFEDEHNNEYIYKEPKLTQLSEISIRLQTMYSDKFGHENVKLIQESGKVVYNQLDPKYAYIQVTYVLPYFDEEERLQRKTYFEQQHNVRNFVFETPFTPGGKARGDIEEQWKRKTILTTEHSFPYIKKRILVRNTRSFELKPIEVALDEMTQKCNELEQLVQAERIDLKKLQLRLQGSVSVQVNAGPLAYAKAFLDKTKIHNHAANTTELLRQVYRRFVELCGKALDINAQLITSNQEVYHQTLHHCYLTMTDELSAILEEQLLQDDDDTISISTAFEAEQVFSQISGSSVTPKRSVAGSVSDASVV